MLCAVLSRFSCIRLFVTLWTVALQAPLSMEFFRQEYWSGLFFPSPGALPDPRIETVVLTSHALADRLFTTSTTWSLGIWRTWGTFLVAAETEGTGFFVLLLPRRKRIH